MANARCPGCGMMAADPLGHLAHGMAQNTPEPTFAGKSLDQVVEEIKAADPMGIVDAEAVAEAMVAIPSDRRPIKNKGGRPRKA